LDGNFTSKGEKSMAINRIELKNFLVFQGDFAADFCPGVNVLIGGNATGKTTLLKVLYWACEFSNKSVLENNGNLQLNRSINSSPHNTIFLLYNYFNLEVPEKKTDVEFISNIKLYSDKIDTTYPALDVQISKNLGSIQFHDVGGVSPQHVALAQWCRLKIQSIFIPVTEMLSHSRGFLALNRERPVPFDCTEIDIISKAELEPTRDVTKNAQCVLDYISKVIVGKVVFDGKDFFVEHENDGSKIPFSLEASGYRKFGLLWKLLRNGLLENGSVLFWDEPENSLNPELVPVLVDILLTLARNGVQIFLATHNYHLARYFDVRKDKSIPVMYHNLSKAGDQIICNSSHEYIMSPDNLLEKAGEDLFNAVIADAMGVQNDE